MSHRIVPDIVESMNKYPQTYEEVLSKFKNRPLEPFCFDLWGHTIDLKYMKGYLPAVREYLNRSVLLAEELAGLMELIYEANTGTICGRKFKIAEVDSLNAIRDAAEVTLKKRINDFKIQEFYVLWFPLVPKDFSSRYCEDFLSKIPQPGDILEHKDGHYDNDSLREHIQIMNDARQAALDMIPYPEREFPIAILAHAYSIGAPMKESAFRDLYDFLEMFGEIPEDVRHRHNTTSDPYARQRYIKSIYARNKWIKDLKPLKCLTPENLDDEDDNE